MKLTRKIIATIVVILSLVMTFTGCEMLDDILGQISGTPVEHQCESVCTECGKCTDLDCEEDICAEKCEGHNQGSENAEIKTGTAYKFGMAQGNKGGDIYYLSGGTASIYYLATSSNILEAVDVYVEEANGGYHLYYEKGGKHYINVEKVTGSDGKDHVNAVIADTAVTVYTYNTELKTLTVTIDNVSYALGTRNDKEYTTVGPCDISKDPFVCTFHIYEGGNPDGGTGTDENGKFDLSLIPEPDFNAAGFDGYYVVNNNVPFFTDAEKHTAECFERYSSLDSLGRVGVAFACVCNNTMPPEEDTRGDIGHIKPTGWHQNMSYSGLNHLYDRSHLIAWSLTDEDDNAKNLATGTVYMNQHSMKIFENTVLNYLKSNKATNKVLYRVTPVFNGDNLLCSGVLMEAYSLDDNGTDVQFCVFVYNIQEGVHLDYATGKNRLATSSDAPYYGTEAGFGTSNQGGNQGDTTNPDQGGTTNPDQGGNTPEGGNQGGTTPDDGNTGVEDEKTFTFVLNTNSKKIHDPDCSSVAKIAEKNRKDWTGTYAELQQLLDSGYTTCGTCKPATE